MGKDDDNAVDTSCGARMSRLGRAICNTEKGEFLNRTPSSWAKIIVFYILFYSTLAGFFAAMLAGFFATMDPRFPTQSNMHSLLKMNPGMGFRPKPEIESTLIQFTHTDNKTYSNYVTNIEEYLKEYMEPQNGTVVDCGVDGINSTDEKVCRVPSLSAYGPCNREEDYGYKNAKPCVLLKINKVINFMPESFGVDNRSDTEDQAKRRRQAQEILPGGVLPTHDVAVTCQGQNTPDQDFLKEVKIYPSEGLPFKWFPYRNQLGYRPPLVFAQFNNFTKGVVIQVWCKMWAKNIKHHKNDKAGSVYFEILID